MTVPSLGMPSVELLLIIGRAVFLVFSFVLATVAFSRWRRASQAQTAVLIANHQVVLQRLADLVHRERDRLPTLPLRGVRLGAPIARPPKAQFQDRNEGVSANP